MQVRIELHATRPTGDLHLGADLDSDDGRRIASLAATLRATETGPDPIVRRRAAYDASDHARAPLFLVHVATDQRAFDPPPRRRPRCGLCGLPGRRELPPQGYRVAPDALSGRDLVRSHQEWLVSVRLGERLRELRGVVLHGVRGAPGYVLRWRTDTGYPLDGVRWDDPCDACGRRSGTTPPGYVSNVHRYAMRAWSGDDVAGTGPSPYALVVSRGVRRLLEDPAWVIPERSFEPVFLAPGDPP